MDFSTWRPFETLNPPLIVVIWTSNVFLERNKAGIIREEEEMHIKKRIGMFEDVSVDVIAPLGYS